MDDPFPIAMPLHGLIGGLMIGTAAAIMLLALGQIADVSGLAARASGIASEGAPRALLIAFVVGLPLGAALVELVAGPVVARFHQSAGTLIFAGIASAPSFRLRGRGVGGEVARPH
jgi:hypothetical protein